LGFNRLSEKIALAALDDRGYYLETAKKIQEDKQLYYEFFATCEGFTAFLSDANFILVRYPAPMKQRLVQRLTENGITVKFLDDPALRDCMRITVGTREQNRYLLSALDGLLSEHRRMRSALATMKQ
jgi:histidinol-phosphate aminotransferase